MLSRTIQDAYEGIRLLERYKALSARFQAEKPFEEYDSNKALEILQAIDRRFFRGSKEEFFGLNTLEDGFDLRMNLSLKHGVVESVVWGKNLTTNEQFGGPVSRTARLIQSSWHNDNVARIPYPRFSSYDDLEEIAKEILAILHDLKSAVNGARP
jgi:hypothetical protein